MNSCGHDWQPIPNWYGRYRCRWCGVVGYRNIVLGDGDCRTRTSQIRAYVCHRCRDALATSVTRGKGTCRACQALG